MTIEELLPLIEKRQPPAPEDRIREFEAEIGAPLPEDYRRFLTSCNGGFLGGRLWYPRTGPHGRHDHVGLHHIGGFRAESHFSLESARACYQSADEVRIPLELLWIMDDPFGNAFCLGLSGANRGRMYFWDHDEEPDPDEWDGSLAAAENVSYLADSFTELVSGLVPLSEVPEHAG